MQAPPSITYNKATNDNIISWFTRKGKATKLQLLKAHGQSSGLISNRCTKKMEIISGKWDLRRQIALTIKHGGVSSGTRFD